MLLRTLTITTLISISLIADVIDVGTYANTYPIKEKSFKLSIQEGIAELNITELKNSILSSVETFVSAKYNLPLSDKEEHYIKQNTYTVPFNIFSPDGTVAYTEGETVISSVPKGVEMNLCFVDARYPELLPAISKEFGKCIYFIANNRLDKNYPDLISHSTDGRIYPVSERYIKRFSIETFPTKVKLYEDKMEYKVLNMKKMLKKFQMGEL